MTLAIGAAYKAQYFDIQATGYLLNASPHETGFDRG